MNWQLYTKILHDFETDYHPKEIIVGLNYGGESLLHPEFSKYLRALDIVAPKKIQLATNGTLLTKEVMQSLLDANVEVAISLHKSRWLNQVVRKTKQLYQMKTHLNLPMTVRANIVAEESSQKEIDSLTASLHHSVDQIRIVTYITEDLKTASEPTQWYPLCPSMFMYLAILWNGDTIPCCHLLSYDNNFTLGNIHDKSIKQVFHGKAYQALRVGETEKTPCQNCEVRR